MSNLQVLLDQIRNISLLSNTVSKTVKLRKNGKEFLGLCPFHGEKSPSFTVNDQKGFYHCFGCGAHGDIVKFLIETRKISFLESVELLAGEINLDYKKYLDKKIDDKEKQLLEQIYLINQRTGEWFENNLKTEYALDVRKYLKERGVKDLFIAKFRLGYSGKNSLGLTNYLMKEKFTKEELVKSGVIIGKSEGEYYDRFRNRLIFPILDLKNRIIAFGGRTLDGANAKYVNSSESMIFNKSEVLYGENFVKSDSSKKDYVILVEGYLDVIMMHQLGFAGTVAALGTAVTKEHLIKLWKLSDEPVIFLDGDAAGQKSMERISELALEIITPGHSLKFVINDTDKDPADLCEAGDLQQIISLIEKSLILSEFIWTRKKAKMGNNYSPEKISSLEKDLEHIVRNINDFKMKSNFKSFFKTKIWLELKTNYRDNKPSIKADKSILLNLPNLSYTENLEYNMINLVINHPILLKTQGIFEEFSQFQFSNKINELISQLVVNYYLKYENGEEIDLNKQSIYEMVKFHIREKLDFIEKDLINSPEKAEKAFETIISKIRLTLLQNEHELYLKEFTSSSTEKAQLIYDEIKKLKEKIRKLELSNDDY